MSEESIMALRASKNANIILSISNLYNIPLREATDIYYKSDVANLIENKIADLHCRSDKYLASLIWEDTK